MFAEYLNLDLSLSFIHLFVFKVLVSFSSMPFELATVVTLNENLWCLSIKVTFTKTRLADSIYTEANSLERAVIQIINSRQSNRLITRNSSDGLKGQKVMCLLLPPSFIPCGLVRRNCLAWGLTLPLLIKTVCP